MFREIVQEYRDEDGELVVTARLVGVRTERVPTQEQADGAAGERR